MSRIKEHYHDKIQSMHYEDYYSQTPERAAITARAETLKEIIAYCDELHGKYARTPLWTIQEVKMTCEEKLKQLSL